MIGARQTTTSARSNTESNLIDAPLDLKLISTIIFIGGATHQARGLGKVTNESSPTALKCLGVARKLGRCSAEGCMDRPTPFRYRALAEPQATLLDARIELHGLLKSSVSLQFSRHALTLAMLDAQKGVSELASTWKHIQSCDELNNHLAHALHACAVTGSLHNAETKKAQTAADATLQSAWG